MIRPCWFGNPPVEGFAEIDVIEAYMGLNLPANYKYFLQFFSNGGEGDFPKGYVVLFKADEIVERTISYEMNDWAPHLLPIGLEGDDIFCFDLSSRRDAADYKVVKVSLAVRDKDESDVVGNNFSDFLERWIKNKIDD